MNISPPHSYLIMHSHCARSSAPCFIHYCIAFIICAVPHSVCVLPIQGYLPSHTEVNDAVLRVYCFDMHASRIWHICIQARSHEQVISSIVTLWTMWLVCLYVSVLDRDRREIVQVISCVNSIGMWLLLARALYLGFVVYYKCMEKCCTPFLYMNCMAIASVHFSMLTLWRNTSSHLLYELYRESSRAHARTQPKSYKSFCCINSMVIRATLARVFAWL